MLSFTAKHTTPIHNQLFWGHSSYSHGFVLPD